MVPGLVYLKAREEVLSYLGKSVSLVDLKGDFFVKEVVGVFFHSGALVVLAFLGMKEAVVCWVCLEEEASAELVSLDYLNLSIVVHKFQGEEHK